MVQLTTYSRLRASYPAGMTIAGVAVGGVDPQTATQRLLQVYDTPIEIQYAGAVLHMDPSLAGFQIDTESMLAAADLQRTGSSFWGGFWDYLWNQQTQTSDVPLIATFSEDRLRAWLRDEIGPRYDTPAIAAQPIPGQPTFAAGTTGQELDANRAVILIEDALRSPTNRAVALTFQRTSPGRPPLQNLETLLKQVIELSLFDGVVGVYMLDLQNGAEVHFGYNRLQTIPVEPDIAFTASSTIKIPILVSAYKNLGPSLDEAVAADVL